MRRWQSKVIIYLNTEYIAQKTNKPIPGVPKSTDSKVNFSSPQWLSSQTASPSQLGFEIHRLRLRFSWGTRSKRDWERFESRTKKAQIFFISAIHFKTTLPWFLFLPLNQEKPNRIRAPTRFLWNGSTKIFTYFQC